MKNIAIKVENVSKIYRLGEIGTGTISRDMERWFRMNILNQQDPFLKMGEVNDRSSKGASNIVYSLRDINFNIAQGDTVGIIGRNGAGKSTLLKILSRVTTPSTGRIKINGRVASLLEVGTGFHPELTGRENIYLNGAILGMRKREIDIKLDEIIDFSGVERYIDTPVKRYSSGMYVRLAFAVAANLESEILIVDEVLAVGDADFQKKCMGKMSDVSNSEGRTILFVSHNLAAIQSLCRSGILINNGVVNEVSKISSCIEDYSLLNNQIKNYKSIYTRNKLNYFEYIKTVDDNSLEVNDYCFDESIIIKYKCIIRFATFGCKVIISMLDKYNSTVFAIEKALDFFTDVAAFGELKLPHSIFAPGIYNFRIALWNTDGSVYDIVEQRNQIEIKNINSELDFNTFIDRGVLVVKGNWIQNFEKYKN
jgi:lipopolysaccharide transport system ATP-binding protein